MGSEREREGGRIGEREDIQEGEKRTKGTQNLLLDWDSEEKSDY